ncbi:probable 3-hydroxyisobutyrate dehydrogenase, mitochondrial [Condylostylus longicornis]|uniref:probable 3-hydroxyisobutyrate dehydrogenase, mitochondrial n=1 Tax=Condylostylus longicornis TaxID=2530218 RepID=UPI00244E1E6B|nr:probable 3-hydroxyisobutyrate dehydrogenase, mitochondrial [Condylostylus longicornis]
MALRVIASSKNIKNIVKTIEGNFMRCLATAADNKNIGFIGLGNMGGHMATNLMKKGHKLHVYDVSKPACEAVRAKGAKIADLSEIAKMDYVITMLPNNDIVYNTFEELMKKDINKNALFIDSSTIDPNVVKSIQKIVKAKGARFVDAPVSGGVPGAEQATLTFMVGGTVDEYNAVKPVLEGMGKRITHCGSYGMGQAAKLANNMMLAISMIGVSEAMNLAIRLGLDAQTFADIINSSTGRCWSSEMYNPVPGIVKTAPANFGYSGGFSTDLITKDLGLASGVATASNTPIPMGALAHQIYRTLKSQGLGNKDFSVVYDFMKNESNN